MASTAHILRLPPELVLRSSSYLSTVELGCLRRTCRHIEKQLFESFAKEFFSKRQFMIECVSLEALVGIANHKGLAPYLKEVIIGLDYLDPMPPIIRGLDPPARDLTGQIDHLIFTGTGQAKDMLVEAFSKLPNLNSVGLRDYNARGRYRDGEDSSWRSYGWTTGLPDRSLHNTGRHAHTQNLLGPTLPFNLILYALGQAASAPEHINVFLRSERLPDNSFNVLTGYMQPKVKPVLSRLRTLLLSLEDGQSIAPDEVRYEHLQRVLHHTPLLEHLRLNFRFNQDAANANALLSWFGAPYDPSSPSDQVQFQHLTTLDLGLLSVDVDVLLRAITKFPLTSLSLWKVKLRRVTSATPPPGPGSKLWRLFLEQLGNNILKPLEFESLMIGYPSEVDRMSLFHRDSGAVRFAGKVTTDMNGEKIYEGLQSQVSYRRHFGSDVSTWLKDLAPRTHLPEPASPDLVSSDDDPESDSEDEDDEEEEEEGEEEEGEEEEADDDDE